MMPAAKMMDPVLGIDIHIIQPPGPVPPLPIPHPFVGLLFDPMELAPFIGASVFINGMPKATAGSEGKALPPHIPIGGVFVPPPPGNECEMFMGSATVLFEGEPASYLALPALSCQSIGMPSPPRLKKKPKPILKLPTSVVLPIPMGPLVLIGGPPTISMTVIGMKLVMGAAGKAAKKLRKMQKDSEKVKAVSKRIHKAAKKAMDKLGVPPSVQNKVHKSICTVTGHPVDVATGKVFTDNMDFRLPGPIPLVWERTWYSCSTYEGPLGHGWHHSYDVALVEDDKAVAVRMPDGRAVAFPRLAPGSEHFDRMEKLTLLRDVAGYAVRTKDGLVHCFASAPMARGERPLVSITDRNGDVIRFDYDGCGRLLTILDSAGRLIRVASDSLGRIHQVLVPDPANPSRSIAAMTYCYDPNGNLKEAFDAMGKSWCYAYGGRLLVRETNRNGLSFRFAYDGMQPGACCLRTWGDGGIYDHKLAYDMGTRTTTVEDSLGHKSMYHWDESGLVTKVVDALGNASLTTHNVYNEVEEEVDEEGGKTAYTYDDRGNCVKTVWPDGSALEVAFAGDSAVSAKDAMGGTWEWCRDAQGRLLKAVDPLGRTTAYRWGRRLEAVVDPAGGETLLRWHPSGLLTAVTTPDGAEARWEYDVLGRCVAAIDPKGNVQRREFDAAGQLRWVEEPDGNVRKFERDAEGNVILAKDCHRHVTLRYAGMNRLVSRTEKGLTVEFFYDPEERLTGVRNQAGRVFSYELDPTGEIAAEINYDGARTLFHRNKKGLVAAMERPGGILTKYTYDPMDRLVLVKHSTGESEAFSWRPDGEMASAANHTVKVVFERDVMGNQLKEVQGGFWVESRYDALGNRVEAVSSLGARVAVERNKMGDTTCVAYSEDGKPPAWEARIVRDAAGLEINRQLPGGVKSVWVRDKVGRPLRHNIVSPKEFRSLEYAWDVNDRLKSLKDSRLGHFTYEHDPLGNLLWSQHPDGAFLFRMPDAVGNLYRSGERDDRKYGPAGQLLEARSPRGVTRYEYDAEGNLVRRIEPDGKIWTYLWNAARTLAKVVRPDGLEAVFTYDALGRRVSKTFRGRTTCWVWDANNPLHEWVEGDLKELPPGPATASQLGAPAAAARRREAELTAIPSAGPPPEELGTPQAPITWIFSPDGPFPMAKIAGSKCYSIVSDHIGTPLAMFDAQGQEAWSAHIDVHGCASFLKGDPFACPFRFPGQYEDAETGLCYNRFRYYDPEGSAYISQDPLRLMARTELYAYAHDPSTWSDPFGLYDGVNFSGTNAMYEPNEGEKNEVRIQMQGARNRDFTQANKEAGFKKKPELYTWHHVNDFDPKTGECTLQLVKTPAHQATLPHSGSVSQFEKEYGVVYDKSSALDVSERNGWLKNKRPMRKKKNQKKEDHCKA